jgi:hypothetical protein
MRATARFWKDSGEMYKTSVVFIRLQYRKPKKKRRVTSAGFGVSSSTSELSFAPPSCPRRHLYSSRAPVLAVVVPDLHAADPRTLQRLFFGEGSEDPKDDRHAGVELHAHERLRDAFRDVLEVHGRAFDEHPDCDHRVERPVQGTREVRAHRRTAVARDGRGRARRADLEPPQQIRRGRTGLDMGTGDHPHRRKKKRKKERE